MDKHNTTTQSSISDSREWCQSERDTASHSVQRRTHHNRKTLILVDPEDEWLLEEYTWHISSDGYPVTNVVLQYGSEGERIRKYTLLHHCIMGQPIWEGEEIDHKNRIRHDCQRQNLQYITKSGNQINTSRAPGNTGMRNIYYDRGKYKVSIRRDGELHYLGMFDTLDEAVAERDEWLSMR
jgi:hypothetical protein